MSIHGSPKLANVQAALARSIFPKDFSERRLEPRSPVRTLRILSNRPAAPVRVHPLLPGSVGGWLGANRPSDNQSPVSLLHAPPERHFVHASITN